MTDSSCILLPPDGDFNIYSIENGALSSRYFIDFGHLALPESTIMTRENCEEIDRGAYFTKITDIRELDKWLYILAVGPNAKYYQLLIDKANKKVICGKPDFEKETFGIVFSNKDTFYALTEPSYILSAKENSMIYHLVDDISEEDNPVLFKFVID